MTTLYICPGCDEMNCNTCNPRTDTLEEIVFGAAVLATDIVHIKNIGRWVVVFEKDSGRIWGEPIKCASSFEALKRLFEVRALYGLEGFEAVSK